MLDEISYTKRPDGQVMKNVRRDDRVVKPHEELAAIRAQLEDIISGNDKEPTPEAENAIANYREQIAELMRLAKVV